MSSVSEGLSLSKLSKSFAQAVDERNIPGYQHVDSLAEYLVELREQTALFLNNQQTDTIIFLWQSLDDYDKQQVVYAALCRAEWLSGRFRTPKKSSTTHVHWGQVQWPDCCRLVENIHQAVQPASEPIETRQDN